MAYHIPMHGNKKPLVKSKKTTATKTKPKKRAIPLPPIDNPTPNEIAISMAQAHRFFVVFDLDGCVSNDAWRFQFVQERDNSRDRFLHYHRALHLDEPLDAGAKLLRDCIDMGAHPVFITARPEAFRGPTQDWLARHFGIDMGVTGTLLMRADDEEGTPTVEVKRDLMALFITNINRGDIVAAYDDRLDVVTMYNCIFGVNAYVLDSDGMHDALNLRSHHMRVLAPSLDNSGNVAVQGAKRVGENALTEDEATNKRDYNDVADIMRTMADTFEAKNAQYGNNGIKVGDVMAVLFPNGMTVDGADDHRMHHLFNLLIVKLTRFVNSGLKHADSIHDLGVYAAMVESEVPHHHIEFKP